METISTLTGGILSITAGIRHSASITTTADSRIPITILSIMTSTVLSTTAHTITVRTTTDSEVSTATTTMGAFSTGTTDTIHITAITTITAIMTGPHMAGGSGQAPFRPDGAAEAAAALAAPPEEYHAEVQILQQVQL